MFPLTHKMLVALTDHIDRNFGKRLLCCPGGFVHSWVLREIEVSALGDGVQRPAVVVAHIPKRRVDIARINRSSLLSLSRRGKAHGGWTMTESIRL